MGYIDKIVRSFWGLLALFSVIIFGATGLTRMAYDLIIINANTNQIEELSQRSLQRAELLVDNSIETLRALAANGLGDCSVTAISEYRRIGFLRGSFKDIQVLDLAGRQVCAGNVLTRDFGLTSFEKNRAFAAAEENVTLYDISGRNPGLVGVGLRLTNGRTLMAILNLDILMLDVFPTGLRDHARADLLLGGDVEIATHVPDAEVTPPSDELMAVVSKSTHLPLVAMFNVHTTVLNVWNRQAEPYVVAAGVLLGLVLGALSISVLIRPRDPDEELRCAIQKGEFVPYMQPIFTIGDARIVGCEVLTRWVKPDGSVVTPNRFIPQAEETGLIVPMTRSIMRTALEALKPHLKKEPYFKVAFNITPADLVSDLFAEELCAIVKEAGVARRQIVLELTERQDFDDLEVAIKAIKELRETGFMVSLDDTGTGHNGLSYVQQLGADIIKIDKYFIDRIGMDGAATTIVQMLVRLADELGMRTVAEGIETEQQMKALLDCQVDEGQGFLISPPVPAEEFLEFVNSSPKAQRLSDAA